MNGPNKMTEAWMDAVACETLGANTSEESVAYAHELADAGSDARQTDRALRETVARLSAASPYMAPPADLRGRILQATAPATFKMEDYRKATQETGKFYRWGFYAAMFFLMAGAYYNLSVKSALKQAKQQVASVTDKANDLLKKAKDQAIERDTALAAFVNPSSQSVRLTMANQQFGTAIVNQETRTAVLVLPEELVAQGRPFQFQMPHDGAMVQYQTLVLTAPARDLHLNVPEGQTLQTVLNPKSVVPDTSPQTLNASFSPFSP